MARETITVLLGDPRLPDRTKPGGRYTADDLDQIVRLKAALAELTDYTFEYLDDHEALLGLIIEAARTRYTEGGRGG